ncbi:MATE family efflux transporter [uncultured Bacteroides sp.]|uniref:MATE family efflux transporter n=1 Tax=uncultured Bacteroides sp. TaxID=162156 RepID=UPI00280AE648|nr:MATE family efflux transporter [uncultured Bacteroides sp.]
MKHRDRQILQIALPSIVSNITVPLLGLIDVAIVGHLGSPAYIGAIAVGGMLFNIIYWIFGFLRMGTSGMTSQAFGKRDLTEVVCLLMRSVGIGLAVAFCLIALQIPIRQGAFLLIHPTDEVRILATLYFHICIWGAPAMLGLYGLTGWFIGMQNSRIPMYIAITQNIVNIIASLSLVYLCGMKVEGVALGTLIAQYAGLFMGLALWWKHYGKLKRFLKGGKNIWQKEAMYRFFQVNRDIFLRTLCLVAVTLFFTSAGASQGEIILAVNTLLMQLFTLFSYVMDGFAYAGEALSGRYIGARNREAFTDTVRHLFGWGVVMAVFFTLVYALGGNAFLGLLTDDKEVIAAADTYFYWALAVPAVGIAAFIWDGIFIGATATRGMLLSMATAAASFFVLYYGLHPVLANHALWLAFLTYLLMRGVMQTGLSRVVIRKAFSNEKKPIY